MYIFSKWFENGHLFVRTGAWHKLKIISLHGICFYFWSEVVFSFFFSRVYVFFPDEMSKTGSELATRWTDKYRWKFSKHAILTHYMAILNFEQLYRIFFSGEGGSKLYMHIKKKERREEDSWYDADTIRARVCELTVTVFASDIEKMRCVCAQLCNVSIFLSDMCVPVWTFVWYWFMFE